MATRFLTHWTPRDDVSVVVAGVSKDGSINATLVLKTAPFWLHSRALHFLLTISMTGTDDTLLPSAHLTTSPKNSDDEEATWRSVLDVLVDLGDIRHIMAAVFDWFRVYESNDILDANPAGSMLSSDALIAQVGDNKNNDNDGDSKNSDNDGDSTVQDVEIKAGQEGALALPVGDTSDATNNNNDEQKTWKWEFMIAIEKYRRIPDAVAPSATAAATTVDASTVCTTPATLLTTTTTTTTMMTAVNKPTRPILAVPGAQKLIDAIIETDPNKFGSLFGQVQVQIPPKEVRDFLSTLTYMHIAHGMGANQVVRYYATNRLLWRVARLTYKMCKYALVRHIQANVGGVRSQTIYVKYLTSCVEAKTNTLSTSPPTTTAATATTTTTDQKYTDGCEAKEKKRRHVCGIDSSIVHSHTDEWTTDEILLHANHNPQEFVHFLGMRVTAPLTSAESLSRLSSSSPPSSSTPLDPPSDPSSCSAVSVQLIFRVLRKELLEHTFVDNIDDIDDDHLELLMNDYVQKIFPCATFEYRFSSHARSWRALMTNPDDYLILYAVPDCSAQSGGHAISDDDDGAGDGAYCLYEDGLLFWCLEKAFPCILTLLFPNIRKSNMATLLADSCVDDNEPGSTPLPPSTTRKRKRHNDTARILSFLTLRYKKEIT